MEQNKHSIIWTKKKQRNEKHTTYDWKWLSGVGLNGFILRLISLR